MAKFDISGLSKAEVLRRLYNGGFNDVNHGAAGLLQRHMAEMTPDEAQELIDQSAPHYYFDYVEAKALKVDLSGDVLDSRLYDRDCGIGAAARALRLPPIAEGDE